jgi:hypothetical protein
LCNPLLPTTASRKHRRRGIRRVGGPLLYLSEFASVNSANFALRKLSGGRQLCPSGYEEWLFADYA